MTPRHRTVLGCCGHSSPAGPLFQLCFSVSPPTVARPASPPPALRVPGQGVACGAGCWLPEGVSDPVPLLLQYLLGHWFLSRSLPQIFISDLLLPSDFVDAPQTGVEECLNLLLHRLCCPPCLTSVRSFLVFWLVSWFSGWLVLWFYGWLIVWKVLWLVLWLVGCMAGSLVGLPFCMARSLVGWLVLRLVGCMAGSLVG